MSSLSIEISLFTDPFVLQLRLLLNTILSLLSVGLMNGGLLSVGLMNGGLLKQHPIKD